VTMDRQITNKGQGTTKATTIFETKKAPKASC